MATASSEKERRKPSPSTNPFWKDLTPGDKRRANTALQRPTPNAAQRSLLLDLPPELRLIIYESVLVDEQPINIDADTHKNTTRRSTRLRLREAFNPTRAVIKEPSLLQTCKIIQDEAVEMYYSRNIFYVNTDGRVVRWLKCIGKERRAMLKEVRTNVPPWPAAMEDVDELPILLDCLEHCEARLTSCGMELGEDVHRIHVDGTDPAADKSKEEIKRAMNDEQWHIYHELQRLVEEFGAEEN